MVEWSEKVGRILLCERLSTFIKLLDEFTSTVSMLLDELPKSACDLLICWGTHASADSLSYFLHPRRRNNNGLEASHVVTILIGDACHLTARRSWERWREVAATEEKQVWNRMITLQKPNAKPRLKHWKLQAYDKRIETYTLQRKQGKLTREQYWNKIIKILANRWSQWKYLAFIEASLKLISAFVFYSLISII